MHDWVLGYNGARLYKTYKRHNVIIYIVIYILLCCDSDGSNVLKITKGGKGSIRLGKLWDAPNVWNGIC